MKIAGKNSFFIVSSIFLPIIIAVLLTACGSGGGGGGNTDPGTTNNNVSNSIGPNGGTVISSDGKAKIVLPSGALSQDTSITVAAVSNQPSGNIDAAYEFGPDGTTFNHPVTISIIYDEASLPSGFNESDIKLGRVTNNQWQALTDSNVDTVANIVSGTTGHLSTYGVIAVSSAPYLLAPTGVAAAAGDGKATISWDAVSGATSYNIYWSTTSGVSKTSDTGKITDATSPYPHTGLINGSTYYYVVTAVNNFGESVESSQVLATPQAPISLPKTGQTTCYDGSGNEIACTGSGQDGDIQAGITWPNPRFTDNGSGILTDKLTNLIWTKDGNAPGPAACYPATAKLWQAALDYVTCLNNNSYLGYTDWRLPNINELRSLKNEGQSDTSIWLNNQGFTNAQSGGYWSSTTYANITSAAWNVNFVYMVVEEEKPLSYMFVWPVRSGQ